ncbi:MAG: hypothetical protein ACE5EQ_07225 [Phycisphaerae bacterium]
MPLIPPPEHDRLQRAIHDHDFLHRLARRIETLHRVVFHAQALDRHFVRAAAEEILIADIVTRHEGNIDGVYFALRKIEDTGRDWRSAIDEYASYAHNYFTTPLGVILRKDLFGEDSHFVTPAAGKDSAMPENKSQGNHKTGFSGRIGRS